MMTSGIQDLRARFSVLRNWLSLVGLTIAVGSLFSFLLLFILDSVAHFANPYLGVITYLVAPGFLVLGVALAIGGALWHRHRIKASLHLSIADRVEHISVDEERQKIPWVRLTDSQGIVTVFKEKGFTNEISRCEIRTNDCNICHTILAQGNGPELQQLTAAGQKFKHPEDLYDPAFVCTDCHTGGP